MSKTIKNTKEHTSNGVVESKLGQMASLVRRVEDFVVEDREVEGQPKTDGVGGSKLSLSDLGGALVSLKRSVGCLLATVTNGELGEITVVVTLPVDMVNFCFFLDPE